MEKIGVVWYNERMRRKVEVKRGWMKLIVLVVAGILGVTLFSGEAYAGVNDFYFESFEGDYYLSKDEDGMSKLKVVEKVVAVFPEYKQNKGICRYIPFTNQDGANITLPNLTRNNIKVTRNGISEPVYSIEKSGDYYEVCTGTDEYVLGKQTYTFEYEFEKVVTDFGDYQELYWDTNGTGSSQRFDKVVARVHFNKDIEDDFTGNRWCYVGKDGEKGKEKCQIVKTTDGVYFEANNLAAYENLTFDVEIKAGSFVVPEPERNYTLVWIMLAIGFLLILILVLVPVRLYFRTKEKRKFYEDLFVKPEYQPDPNYSVAEMAEVYMGRKKDAKVAVMLDMIIKKKITLINIGTDKRKKWKVKVLNLDGVSSEGKTLLAILNGGSEPGVGDELEIKSQKATTKLISLGRKYDKDLKNLLIENGLVEKKYALGNSGVVVGDNNVNTSSMFFLIVFGLIPFLFPMAVAFLDIMVDGDVLTGYIVGKNLFLPVILAMLVAMISVWGVISVKTQKYSVRTEKGLSKARYMDGLKLYIEMAEADRIKFLQSVKGADMSNGGIVHLYEKLLPYAVVFGLENSWMKELDKYYKLDEVVKPDWYRGGVTVQDLYFASRLASSYTRSSTSMSTGSGSSSSGFSGGGGGGFSGGGGGGGGFGGR